MHPDVERDDQLGAAPVPSVVGRSSASSIGTNDAAQALQASAAAARAAAVQRGTGPPAVQQVPPRPQQRPPAQVTVPPGGSFAPLPRARADSSAVGVAPIGAEAPLEPVPALHAGMPSMDVAVRYKRSWSIQEALDQHSTLCRQKEILTKIGANRVRVRRTQLQFAKVEVEDALERVRTLPVLDASDPAKTQALALQVRRATQDLALASRLRNMDENVMKQQLAIAEIEVEKSRQEMKVMKQAIDDKSLAVATDDVPPPPPDPAERKYYYCTNCKVGGHGQRFCEYLLKRPEWRVYPQQKWFEDEKRNEYHCPLGKRLVDFADESHFSRLAMYIKGRVWLEDKTKMWQLVPNLMPDTYIIDDCKWRDGREPPKDSDCDNLPWFVKEADRNWGTSVQTCSKPSQCMDLAKPGATYVVQQHIKNPLCMDDGRKCHIKFYVLLVGMEDAKTWRLYTFKDGYLSISPNKWNPDDLSKETQVTIIRTERIASWRHWEAVYPKCKAGVAEVIRTGVKQGKLEGRLAKRQFEILSSDFIVDTDGNVWLFEFNMSPVLKDPQDSPQVHDADMITAALDIVVPWENSSQGNWDFAGEFVGEPPAPTVKAPAADSTPSAEGASVVGTQAPIQGGSQDPAGLLEAAGQAVSVDQLSAPDTKEAESVRR